MQKQGDIGRSEFFSDRSSNPTAGTGDEDSLHVESRKRPTSNAQRPTQKFEEALDDDLNISAALGFLFESIRETNRAMDEDKLDPASANAWLNWWNRINTVLDLEPETKIAVPEEVAQLAKERQNARREKNWKRSDELRDRISTLGWDVRDTKVGQKLTPRGMA